MITETDICNLALSQIGVDPIVSLDDDSPQARKCAAVYHTIRQNILRKHNWSFAKYPVTLALLTDVTIPGWDYVYSYPAKCLNIQRVYNDSTLDTTPTEKYEKIINPITEEIVIATDTANAYADYTFDNQNTATFDPAFCDAFSWAIAAAVALPLTGEQSKAAFAMQMLKLSLDSAMNANQNESNDPVEPTSSYYETR